MKKARLSIKGALKQKEHPDRTVIINWRPSTYGGNLRWSLAWYWHKRFCQDCGKLSYTWAELRTYSARKREGGGWRVTSQPVKDWHGRKPPREEFGPRIECACFGKRGPRRLQASTELADFARWKVNI